MSIIQELRQRKIFRAAALYAVIAWVILQVVDVVSEPLGLPLWFATLTIVLLAVGFPLVLIFSWIFDIRPDHDSPTAGTANPALGVRGGVEIALLLTLIVGIGWLVFRDLSNETNRSRTAGLYPVVVLMDTYAAQGVYDEETRRKSGTNADVLSELLADLPVVTQKEAIGSTWDREAQVLKQHPDLVLIHRSAFFHSMNQDLGVGYPRGDSGYSEEFHRLYQIADNKLVALLGFLAKGSEGVQFIIYSRGTDGGWTTPEYREQWVHQAEGRFPELKGRITTIAVPGGVSEGSFRRPDSARLITDTVQGVLQLDAEVVE